MHITIITNKATLSINIILRCFHTKNHNNYIINNVKAIAFKSCVRPLLEYASIIWNSYRYGLNNIEIIENVQRYLTKRVFFEM